MLHGSTWVLNCDIAPVPLCPISQTSLLCHQDLLSVLGRQLEKDEWGRREVVTGRKEVAPEGVDPKLEVAAVERKKSGN